MKIHTLLALFAFALLSAGCQPDVEPQMEALGAPVSLTETTSIADILANPAMYVGKKVRIEGRIKDVCPMKGCWVEVETADGQQALTVKVNDGEIIFKPESKGKEAIAEGEVYAIEMDVEQAISYMAHLAEEKGEVFDSTTVNGPMTIYQIKGAGALVAK